jgi:MATE family multidrug resistance protein
MNREILRLAVPNILSNISIPLLSTVDTILMGHLSASHLGAVGIGSMIFNFIYWNFGFLRMGTTGVTAQAYGAKDNHQISNTLYRAVLIALLLAVFILVVQWPLWHASAYLMNVDANQYELVKTYFEIRLLAAPAALASYAILGWFFGMQNAIYPLILTIFVNLVNIALSAYLVLVKAQGIEGVAIGTVISQYGGFVLAFLLIYLKYRGTLEKIQKSSIFIWEKIKHFLVINRDIFIRTVCLTFVFGFFYSQSSKSGEMFLAANVILLQFLNWMSYGVDGFAFASESLVGKYTGANDEVKTNKAIRFSFYWGGVLALLYALAYGFGGESLLHIFTDQQDVIDYTRPYLIWVIILPIIGFSCYIWDGVFIGLTASNAMRDSMLISLALFLIIFYAIPWHNQASQLWMSLLLFLAARGLIQTWMYWKEGIALR